VALLPTLPADAQLEPVVHYVLGVALAQMGDLAAADDSLSAALAEARECELPFETLLALDALVTLDGSPARREERDRLLAQLDVVRLPAPPLAVSGSAGRPGRPGPRS
jgi:hypothetical protein